MGNPILEFLKKNYDYYFYDMQEEEAEELSSDV